MKNSRLVYSIAALALCSALSVKAQDFSSVLASVESNNTTLKALRADADASKAQARTGLTLSDPSVTFDYLWGSGQADRIDLGVAQEFDFPTTYYWRKKVSEGECSRVEYEYRTQRQQILLEAKDLCIDMVYFNSLEKELERRTTSAKTLADSYQKLFEKGEVSVVELNRAKLDLMNVSKDLESNQVDIKHTLSELKRLNGGQDISVTASEFGVILLPENFDQWMTEACANSPELQLLNAELEEANSSVKLAASESLPKFSLGYVSEYQGGNTLKGIGTGISIPLWENKGRVKAAKAKALASQAKINDSIQQYENTLRSDYIKAQSLQKLSLEYRQMLSTLDTSDSLDRALEAGEISLFDYVQAVEIWYEALFETVSSERDCAKILAEITSWEL